MSKFLDLARSVIDTEIDALSRLSNALGDSFDGSIEALVQAVAAKNKVVIIGVGKSGNIGHKIAATLTSTGVTAVVLNSQNALHGDLGLISDGDVVIAMSYSGETAEMLTLLPFIRRRNVQLISITGAVDSTLARHSHFVLDTSVEREACPHNLAPTASSTAMLAMGDALAMVLLEARGFSADDFAQYHPGGSLGRALLTRVADVMRGESSYGQVMRGAPVSDALLEMSRARCGACVVLEPDQSLAGIFTHGDFARSFQSTPNLGEQKIDDFMSVNPITVNASDLAAEAVKVLSAHRIDDIIVLDKQGMPVGLIDSQDLARLKLV